MPCPQPEGMSSQLRSTFHSLPQSWPDAGLPGTHLMLKEGSQYPFGGLEVMLGDFWWNWKGHSWYYDITQKCCHHVRDVWGDTLYFGKNSMINLALNHKVFTQKPKYHHSKVLTWFNFQLMSLHWEWVPWGYLLGQDFPPLAKSLPKQDILCPHLEWRNFAN